MTGVTTRRMLADDLAGALKLTQSQGWPHRIEDWEFHFRLGRGWVACDATGTLLGTTLWWPYGNKFGTVGLVVVDPGHQGKGIGRRLLEAVIEDAGSRALQLVATRAGIKLYQQCGFQEQGAISQNQGIPLSVRAVPPADGIALRSVTRRDLAALVTIDAAAFGTARQNLIAEVLATGLGGVMAEHGGLLKGYALARPFGRGTIIGPVVASDQSLAISLVSHQLGLIEGFTRVDLPAEARELATWLSEAGLPSVDQGTIMVRGVKSMLPAEFRIFGLISQALC